MLNNNGSNIEFCDFPRHISEHLLYEEHTLTLCFFKLN